MDEMTSAYLDACDARVIAILAEAVVEEAEFYAKDAAR